MSTTRIVGDKISSITSFDDRWYKETTFTKIRDIHPQVKLVLLKKANNICIDIHLDFNSEIEIPTMFDYGLKSYGSNAILLEVFTPKDNDGTEEDIKQKINETIIEAEKRYNNIQEHHIISLIQYIEEYQLAVSNIYKIKNQIVEESKGEEKKLLE